MGGTGWKTVSARAVAGQHGRPSTRRWRGPVTVLTFAPGFPRIREVVTAARAASRLTDARLAQVFDVEENWDQAYVVMEWVAGDSLHDMLADGPLEPGQSAEIIAEGAEALASAHAAGRGPPVPHARLAALDQRRRGEGRRPRHRRRPVRDHLRRPGARRHLGARQAPLRGADRPLAGRGVARAATGAPVARRAALQPAPGPGRGALSRRRHHLPGTVPERARRRHRHDVTGRARRRPPPGDPGPGRPARRAQHTGPDWDEMPPGPPTGQRYWQLAPEPPRRGAPPGPRRPGGRPRASGAMLGLGAVLVVLLVGIGVWILGHRGSPAHGGPPPTHSASSSASSSASVLAPVSAHGFDALSSPSDDPGNENDQLANLAIDGNPSTSWNTQFYIGNPVFGGTKTGTGLILDMGKPVRLSSVRVTFGPIPGADVQIKLGNNNTRAPSDPVQLHHRRPRHRPGGHPHLHRRQPGHRQVRPDLVHQAAASVGRVVEPVRSARSTTSSCGARADSAAR